MTHRHKIALHMLLLISLLAGLPAVAAASDVPKISKEELNAMFDNPDLVIIDVRRERDWKSSSHENQGGCMGRFSGCRDLGAKIPQKQDNRPLLRLTGRAYQCLDGTNAHQKRVYKSIRT